MHLHEYEVITMRDGTQVEGDEGHQTFHTEGVAQRWWEDQVAAHAGEADVSVFVWHDGHVQVFPCAALA